jgi:DNA-binding winged helix-turn-helix (wHTH) protein
MLYRFGIYAFDPARYDLHHAGQPVALRPQACELLAYLLRHRDRVVPKAELLAQVWPGQYVGDGVLHAGVLAVRTALHDTGRTLSLLHTVRGRGYRFVAPVEVCDLPLDDPPQALHPVQAEPPPLADALLPPPAVSETPAAAALAVGLSARGEYKPVSVLCGGLAEAPALAVRLGLVGLYVYCRRWRNWSRRCCNPMPGPSCRRRVRASRGSLVPRWRRRTMPGGRCWRHWSCVSVWTSIPRCRRNSPTQTSPCG